MPEWLREFLLSGGDLLIGEDLAIIEMAETLWWQVAGTETRPCCCGCGSQLPTTGAIVAVNPFGEEFESTSWA